MKSSPIIAELRGMANPEAVTGMARFGINPQNTLGVSMPVLRSLAHRLGRDHALALELWRSDIHEARILACLIDVPDQVTPRQMEEWVATFDSWDVCDQCCGNLFDKTPFAYEKARSWSEREETFVKRAGFVLMAQLAVHDKLAGNEVFAAFLSIIARAVEDERNFVKKAVNWALRQIGKRNPALNRLAVAAATDIRKKDNSAARWIAADALRELRSEKVQALIRRRSKGETHVLP
ncbi:MAG: DNA alkylation repair protein [Smithellaceae bacterium]|nr:DNA alkylation repair protein [Smithellaceae bacterium]